MTVCSIPPVSRRSLRGRALATGSALVLLMLAGSGVAGASEVADLDPLDARVWRVAAAPAESADPAELALEAAPEPEPETVTEAAPDPEAPAVEQTAMIPAELNRAVDVASDTLTLGDLFSGLPADLVDVPVARAPRAGRSTILNANWLNRIAQSHDLGWRARSPMEQAVVSRPGESVPMAMITAALEDALANAGADPSMEMDLTTNRISLVVPTNSDFMLNVRDVQYDSRTHRFSARIEVPDGGVDTEQVRITGRLHAVQEVPVLSQAVSRSGVITPQDITFASLRSDQLPPDVVLDPQQLVGMGSRQTLRPGEPIRQHQLIEPVVVAKGSLVTMVLEVPGMTVTAKGRALENAGAGDTLRVMNVASNQTVLATVESAGQVTINTGMLQ